MPLLTTEIDELLSGAARLAGEYLEGHGNRDNPVLEFHAPDELRGRLDLALPEKGLPTAELLNDARSVLENSVRTGHPRFFNQLFSGYDPAAILGEWITALLNTSMYTYEVAPVVTLMEHELIRRMGELAGFPECEGVLAPGGSLSNLMALLVAREQAIPGCKEKGLQPGKRLTVFLSREAHYSMRRAAAVAGLGLKSVVDVPTDRLGRMIPAELEQAVERAKEFAGRPFMVAATAGTTVPGAFDPIPAIAAVARRHKMWLHVDGSYGGSVLLSARHRHLMEGVELADSLSWNPHKLMGVPLACAALLVREKGLLRKAFGMGADYLFHEMPGSELDMGDLTLQCGRRVDALKLWLSWRAHGDQGYRNRIDHLFGLAGFFRERILDREGFELAREPQGTNVCFRYMPPALRGLPPGPERDQALSATTSNLRRRLVESGRFLINFAPVDGVAAFRIVLANPQTTEADLEALLDEMEALGSSL